MTKYICHERKGWGTVLSETEEVWTVRWDCTTEAVEVRKDDDLIVDWEDDEEVEADCDRWDLEVGFDPYEGCYTYDC